jgi:hypothetical protein
VPVFCNEVFSEEYEKCRAATNAGRLQQLEDRRDQGGNDKDFLVSPEGDSSLAGLKHGRPRREFRKAASNHCGPVGIAGARRPQQIQALLGSRGGRCLGHAFAAKTDKGIQPAKLAF